MLKYFFLKAPEILFILIFSIFFGKQVMDIVSLQNHFSHTDGYSEDHSKEGAQNFLKNGFAYSAGLSVWPRFPQDTQVPILLEKKIYTHFFPGPDYVLTGVFALFGDSDFVFQWSRLLPLILISLSFLYFSQILKTHFFGGWRWAPFFLACGLLFLPVMKWFTINVHGHGYVTALLFFCFAMGLEKTAHSKKIALYGVLAFCCGLISNYMLLTFSFVVCFSPLVAGLMHPRRKKIKNAFFLSFCIGLGLVAAFILHLWQIAEVVGSWSVAIESQMRIGGVRALIDRGDSVSREMLIGRYSTYVYNFFGMGSISMSLLSFIFISVQRVPLKIKIKWVASVLVAFMASYAWVMALKNHSIDHPHVNPRIFLLLMIVFVTFTIRLMYDYQKTRKLYDY